MLMYKAKERLKITKMAKRNTLKQEYYKTTFNSYWKDIEGKPTIEYVNWLEDKLVKKLNIDDVSKNEAICNCENEHWKEDEGGDWYCTIHDKQA